MSDGCINNPQYAGFEYCVSPPIRCPSGETWCHDYHPWEWRSSCTWKRASGININQNFISFSVPEAQAGDNSRIAVRIIAWLFAQPA